MKKSLMLFILLGLVNASYAGRVTLPGCDVLPQRLRANGFSHVVDNTGLIFRLTYKETRVSNIVEVVASSLRDYRETLGKERELDLLNTILRDSPEAAAEAREMWKEFSRS